MKVGNRHLPWKALSAFEVVGRRGSMRAAAEELAVTPSAVSHQVRALEHALGRALFERRGRQLALTAEGRLMLDAVGAAFDRIGSTSLRLMDDAFVGTLSIAVPPAFSLQWLMPCLPRFLARFPRLTLRSEPCPSGGRPNANADVVIAFGTTSFPGRRVSTLVELEMFPVCAPDYARARGEFTSDALRAATLVHEDDGALWTAWFEATGTEQFRPAREVFAGTTHDALACAAGGGGVAIDDGFMGAAAKGDGRLVRPFGAQSFAFGHYAIALPPEGSASAPAEAFHDWIVAELALPDAERASGEPPA